MVQRVKSIRSVGEVKNLEGKSIILYIPGGDRLEGEVKEVVEDERTRIIMRGYRICEHGKSFYKRIYIPYPYPSKKLLKYELVKKID